MKRADIEFLAAKARLNGCLIVGADLLVAAEGKLLRGDLHMVGEMFVFNGILADGGAAWTWGEPSKSDKLIILASRLYFERRGVVVFAAADVVLSDEARKYLGLGE